MRFTTFALTSAALASVAIAAPAPDWKYDWKPKWRGNGYGGWGKHKQKEYDPPSYESPSNGTEPTTPGTNTTCPATPTFCINDEQAAAGAEIFRQLIQAYSDELALEALTEDFIDYSSAVNIIRNRGNPEPFIVNEATFVGRQAFMDAQGSQPQIPFDTLDTVHGCDSITTRWQTLRSANGQPTEANNIVSPALPPLPPAITNMPLARCRPRSPQSRPRLRELLWFPRPDSLL